MKFILIILLIALFFLQYKLWINKQGLPQLVKLKQQQALLSSQNTELEKQNHSLQVQIKSYKQGTEAYEERAREDLGMTKKGEVFYIASGAS